MSGIAALARGQGAGQVIDDVRAHANRIDGNVRRLDLLLFHDIFNVFAAREGVARRHVFDALQEPMPIQLPKPMSVSACGPTRHSILHASRNTTSRAFFQFAN
jgi:hypothetical protein